MTGDESAVLNMWREMVGDPDYVPEDLSAVWAVQLGSTTEGLNLEWYERKYGALTRKGEVVIHQQVDWMAATLDGWSVLNNCPVEAKHVGGFEKMDTIVSRYQPQLQWQMLVTRAQQCALSVIMGASEPTVEMVPFDRGYADELLRRAEAFMQCVWQLTPPVVLAPVAAPVKPVQVYEMNTNQWASEAGLWLENRAAAKTFAAAEKELKAMVPADAAKCHGFGVEVKRNRVGHLSARALP
jgi:hypothetical protein